MNEPVMESGSGRARSYAGSELELFSRALNWKRYVAWVLGPHLGGRVLEVGAGMGSSTAQLAVESLDEWVCLEPDEALARRIAARIARGELPARCRCRVGRLEDMPADERFDAILYLDVLEHIEDDRGEMERAARHLVPGGRLVVLSPAHQRLYSPFDRAIGHYRRYDRRSLAALAPPALACSHLFYLDSVGLLASLAAALVLRQSMPTQTQIRIWDGLMVPVSRVLDSVLGYALGKSIVGVWRV